ncbi:hypothetical protein MHYMCMPSP_01160 [Hyalomma marginatum]|uniref:Uncharacterized protein n=1 Tax=Hyalomma marginatum TaxID=34627 RepID=A0A8S4BWM0_9ACAR|nr:hypothetical protein MHYMCMPASI_00501 [Hyalomma marginatum]CAG7598843.1 hypothetical protein MHYMCMPSP_01160 [Hyalomma marginatum]
MLHVTPTDKSNITSYWALTTYKHKLESKKSNLTV